MNGISLTLFSYEQEKHHGVLLHEWLLQHARKGGLAGGSVFRGISGYGKDKKVHEEHFFELASNVPVKIQLICTEEQCSQFIDFLKKEKIHLLYYKQKIEYDYL